MSRKPPLHFAALETIVVVGLVAAVAVLAAPRACPAADPERSALANDNAVKASPPASALRTTDLVALARRFATFSDDLPPVRQLGVAKLLAYEENPHFTYLRGSGPGGDRRVIFCKPATFVVYDLPAAVPWRLVCSKAPQQVDVRRFSVAEGEMKLTGQTLRAGSRIRTARVKGTHVVETIHQDPTAVARFIHSFHIGEERHAPVISFVERNDMVTLKLTAGDRTFELILPADAKNPGTIAIAKKAGESVLAKRVLPAGILPHGSKGVQMMERWDSAYRRDRVPGWDVGRPASELKRAVESGALQRGRAVVLGCGAGTNAIYLASQGFEVTGVDLAPTALRMAEKRAQKAGVRVRWLLADVLAVPEVGRFDFVFDRGCYHHVRRYNAAGYVEMLNRLSRKDTHFLLLAGNANEPRHYGPPRVEETDIVNDLAPRGWDFVWLKEIRFDSANPENRNRPWAWSALVRRKAPKE